MPAITLITDFGQRDFYVGALKGKLLSACGNSPIIDISHTINPFSITEAAFNLKNAYQSFPEGTIHLILVNDEDSRKNRLLAIQHNGHFFFGYDNGVFSLVFDNDMGSAVELERSADIEDNLAEAEIIAFVNGIAAINAGQSIETLGVAVNAIRERSGIQPVIQDSLIRASVIFIDSFENIVLNVTWNLFEKVRSGRSFVISFRRSERIEKISNHYHDVVPGEKLCLFNSNRFMELAINSGKAASLLGLEVGDVVQIDFS